MTPLAEALRMLDAFASVRACSFDVIHVNIDGEKRGFRTAQTLGQPKNSRPYLLESAPKRQNNVIIRPHGTTAQLIQLDHLDAEALQHVRPAAFLTLQTSPGSHQAWVAVVAPPAGLARRLRKGSYADKSASGATRVPGTVNYKRKYEPNFPLVTIVEARPGHITTPAELDSLGLLAPPQLAPPCSRSRLHVNTPSPKASASGRRVPPRPFSRSQPDWRKNML